jgi:hypothetical protein
MTEPEERPHPSDPAEGGDPSDAEQPGGRTPHSEDPAEGSDAAETGPA